MRSQPGVAVAALLLMPLAAAAAAQERPAPVVEFAAGWTGFADDGIVSEGLVGGAVRWYLSPRISVGPEILYLDGDRHSHLVATGNMTFDLVTAAAGQPPGVTPFLVVGGGIFQTREPFFNETFTSREGAFTAGGGVRAPIGDRVTVGVDVRVGWELHLRVNGAIGVRLGQSAVNARSPRARRSPDP